MSQFRFSKPLNTYTDFDRQSTAVYLGVGVLIVCKDLHYDSLVSQVNTTHTGSVTYRLCRHCGSTLLRYIYRIQTTEQDINEFIPISNDMWHDVVLVLNQLVKAHQEYRI